MYYLIKNALFQIERRRERKKQKRRERKWTNQDSKEKKGKSKNDNIDLGRESENTKELTIILDNTMNGKLKIVFHD